MSPLLIAVLGGLGAMLGWGLADFFAKVSIDKIGDLPSLVWGHVIGTALLFLFVLGDAAWGSGAANGPESIGNWSGLVFFGLLQAIVYYLLYRGFGKGQVAVLSPTFASFSGLVALVSIVFLGEDANVFKAVSLAVIFVGILLLSTSGSVQLRFLSTPGFKEVVLATAFAASWTLGWAYFVSGHDPITFAFLMYGFMTVALYVTARLERAKLSNVPRRVWLALAVIGLGETTAYASLTWAYSHTDLTSVVALLSGAFSLPTIVLARVFLRERMHVLQTVGAVAVLGGIMVLALRT